jgi:hypothetical protein
LKNLQTEVTSEPAITLSGFHELVKTWQRKLVMRFHPDRGGTTQW